VGNAVKFIRLNMMIKLSRKESFIFSLFGNIIFFFLTYQLWHGIYAGDSGISSVLNFEAVILKLFLAMGLASFLNTNIEWFISRDILSGNIQKYLLIPEKFYNVKFFETIGTSICNLFSNTIPLFIFIFIKFKIELNLSFPLFLFSILISLIIIYNIDLIIGLTSFHTEAIWGISTIKTAIIAFLAGAVIPLEFLPLGFQNFLKYTPFEYIYQVPIKLLTSEANINEKMMMLLMQIICGLILTALAKIIFAHSVKKITINGG